MKHTMLVLAIAALLTGCDESPTVPGALSEAVIQGFLYADEPVTDVRVMSTVELGSADTVGVPINDATVVLIRASIRYALRLAPTSDGYYRYDGSDLTVREGDVFDLEVMKDGKMATARTVVPTRPVSLTLSADSLVVPTFGGGFRPGEGFNPFENRLVARWPNPSGELYYVTIEATDAAATEIEGPFGGGFRRFIFPPIAADSFSVSPVSLAYYGAHQVRVYRVNNEYAALYESRTQDSRDLNEPATNIHNGLGVFSAFSSRTAAFRAVAQK